MKIPNENFLQFIWEYGIFQKENLKTTKGQPLEIINLGIKNTNAGPDFLTGKIKVEDLIWAGNIEIHLKTKDWNTHKHSENEAYKNVILHVVLENNSDEIIDNIPVFELKNYLKEDFILRYNDFFETKYFIPCEKKVSLLNKSKIDFWLNKIFVHRLEKKVDEMKIYLEGLNGDLETLLFQKLLTNYGLKVNKEAFYLLSKQIDYSLFKKNSHSIETLEALLFGSANLITDEAHDKYSLKLKNEYSYLQKKYRLEAINKGVIRFFRMRPANFPTIRLSQFASLYHLHPTLFRKLIEVNNPSEFYDIFKTSTSKYWESHYKFGVESNLKVKNLTKIFIDLLLINVVLPIRILYFEQTKQKQEITKTVLFYEEISAEKNSIVNEMEKIFNQKVKNSIGSQAYLELYKNYCKPKKCLTCEIGISILTNNYD